jgi:ArsR family transcriptional regulator
VEATGATQANISRHLQTLTDVGILARRKSAQHVFYSIGDPTVFELCRHVCGSIQKQMEAQAKTLRSLRG